MLPPDYETLINRGFKIIRIHRNEIQVKVKNKGWAKVCDYSSERWNELLADEKTISDY